MDNNSKGGIAITLAVLLFFVPITFLTENQIIENQDKVWHEEFMEKYKPVSINDVKHFERWVTPTHVEIGCANWDITFCNFSKSAEKLFYDDERTWSWNEDGSIFTIKIEKQDADVKDQEPIAENESLTSGTQLIVQSQITQSEWKSKIFIDNVEVQMHTLQWYNNGTAMIFADVNGNLHSNNCKIPWGFMECVENFSLHSIRERVGDNEN